MSVEIQRQVDADWIPDDASLRRVVDHALEGDPADFEVNIRIVDEAEGRALNRDWRGRDYATNVLSFPAEIPVVMAPRFLGDIVLCAPVVAREAAAQGKLPIHHWTHLLVHGLLHLYGFDHTQTEDAERMENEERRILSALGIDDPYTDGNTD